MFEHERQFAAAHEITCNVTPVDTTPDGQRYHVALHMPGTSPRVLLFTVGFDLPPPDVAMVLSAVAQDAATLLNSDSYEDWCAELGLDAATYREVKAQTESFSEWLGPDVFNDLVYRPPKEGTVTVVYKQPKVGVGAVDDKLEHIQRNLDMLEYERHGSTRADIAWLIAEIRKLRGVVGFAVHGEDPLARAARIVVDDEHQSYPELSDIQALEHARNSMTREMIDWPSPTDDVAIAYWIVLTATDEDLDRISEGLELK